MKNWALGFLGIRASLDEDVWGGFLGSSGEEARWESDSSVRDAHGSSFSCFRDHPPRTPEGLSFLEPGRRPTEEGVYRAGVLVSAARIALRALKLV